MRLRERMEKFGITLEMMELPTNAYVESSGIRNVMLGKSPERDREIDGICQMIRNSSPVPAFRRLKYNLTHPGCGAHRSHAGPRRRHVQHLGLRPGQRESAAHRSGAGQRRRSLGAHHLFPGARGSRGGGIQGQDRQPSARSRDSCAASRFRGVHRVMGSVEGLKRFVSIKENPYHGLNFCQGTVSEMLDRPGEQIYDVIRYFGERKKIFNVHFRNIKGHIGKFQETFPDNGDVDMIRAMRVYKDVGYDGMIMPDHAPRIVGDEGGREAFAFEFGYIAALIQMMNE